MNRWNVKNNINKIIIKEKDDINMLKDDEHNSTSVQKEFTY